MSFFIIFNFFLASAKYIISFKFLNICQKVNKMGSIMGHRIDYNGLGALRDQGTYPAKIKNLPKCVCCIAVG